MNTYIFREYDIRGVVETDFTDVVVRNLGRAFGTSVIRRGGKTIALSGDIRLTTPHLISIFSKGLQETGVDVVLLGIIPTPVNYFSMFHLDVDGAVQITGSHNPVEFNGFKLSFNKMAFFGEQIQEMKTLIQKNDFESGSGNESEASILDDYHQMLKSKIKFDKHLKIVMDSGNACAGITAPAIFDEMDCEVTELYSEVDGTFPNHHPDPTEDHNLAEVVELMKSGEYDLGVAYDGDADRVVAVDNLGQIIRADNMMALFLPEIVNDGDSIVFDVKCSQALEDMILRYGGKPIMWKTGHSLIKKKMKEEHVKFAGEMSGHIFFGDDFFGFDDAVYVALRLAQTLSRTDRKLSDLTSEIPVYYSTPEMRLECPTDEEKFKIAKKAEEYFKENYDCITVDGVRIKFGDGWGLVRSSNTQPVIVCRFEANRQDRMEEIKKIVLSKLMEFGEIAISE
ncbi:MAG: phosphomannomutase/phosphoglucomutase [Candidatus Marinimicrobia bacterium]|jgi:phosphomannomutase/phosphoglucomutase|nr:phosphomannomutase/phosphoglucomutase [Candidatus Neomarinimicrobiota bacterium]MBT3633517.1 phosphomannomutase/phosphoglucomutase [Candidatus Neomarinimicrobiota bacterium]MBT3681659.1 phosphomannomutase/phosphoglucomutase [Candidatus Neomarinimicrobiota bacterium]MBT3758373.1 phosphomannomutase/phosphoglucomutase [Candidatus Neomarinimicrobiota bacterium]MBT3894973.1 phosphomannomutase/phosphoglucomutase [Candidatus Neomarinimicrobiota bacterium]